MILVAKYLGRLVFTKTQFLEANPEFSPSDPAAEEEEDSERWGNRGEYNSGRERRVCIRHI